MKKMKKIQNVGAGITKYFPCDCGESVRVQLTGRQSRIKERPRVHRCKKCGKVYHINAANGAVVGQE